jgi:hypothetical protein
LSLPGIEIFLYSTSSRPALGCGKPPIQFVPVAISPGVKRPRPEADHSRLCSAELKNDEIWRVASNILNNQLQTAEKGAISRQRELGGLLQLLSAKNCHAHKAKWI